MGDLNQVTIHGRVGMDPDLRFTQGGQAVLKLSVATTEKWKDKSDKLQEQTEWHSVVFWGRRAEGLNKVLTKGCSVWVTGKLRTQQWDDKDGNKRYRTEIVANDISITGWPKGGERRQQPRDEMDPDPSAGFATGAGDDDIPF